jgi:ComEC/Rec2-related protein
MARRPIVGLAVALVAGILLGFACGGVMAVAVVWCVVAGAWLWCSRRQEPSWLAWLPVWLLVGLAGWLAAAMSGAVRLDERQRLDRCIGMRVTVAGVVAGEVGRRPLAHGNACYTFALRQVAVTAPGSVAGRVRHVPVKVRWYGPSDPDLAPQAGETWQFATRRLAWSGNPNRPRLNLTGSADDTVFLALPRASDWRASSARLRAAASQRLALGMEEWGNVPTLVQAMLLGCRSEIPPALNRVFRDSGTIHIFAISGMNIALAASVLIFLLGAAGVPRPLWGAVLGPLLLAYTLLTGASASAMRACLMGLLYFGAPLVGRRPDGLATLAAAAIILLMADPCQITDLGFLLSFVVMAGLLLLCMPFARGLRRLFGVGAAAFDARAAAMDGQPETGDVPTGRMRLKQRLLIGLSDLLGVSLAAWVASAPLTAWYFGRFTMGSLPANLLVVPASFLVVVAGVLSLVTGVLSDFLAVTFNHAAAVLTYAMVLMAQGTVLLPGGTFRVPQPPVWVVLGWYAALGVLAWWLARHRSRPVDRPW